MLAGRRLNEALLASRVEEYQRGWHGGTRLLGLLRVPAERTGRGRGGNISDEVKQCPLPAKEAAGARLRLESPDLLETAHAHSSSFQGARIGWWM